MYKGEEKFYTLLLIVIVIGELFLSIPLATDSLLDKGQSTVLTILFVTHIISFAYTQMLDNKGVKSLHIKGFIGFFISFIPVIPFLWHIYTAFSGVKAIKIMYKFIKYDYDERLEKEKELSKRNKVDNDEMKEFLDIYMNNGIVEDDGEERVNKKEETRTKGSKKPSEHNKQKTRRKPRPSDKPKSNRKPRPSDRPRPNRKPRPSDRPKPNRKPSQRPKNTQK